MQSSFHYVSKQQSNTISFSSKQLKALFVELFYSKATYRIVALFSFFFVHCFHRLYRGLPECAVKCNGSISTTLFYAFVSSVFSAAKKNKKMKSKKSQCTYCGFSTIKSICHSAIRCIQIQFFRQSNWIYFYYFLYRKSESNFKINFWLHFQCSRLIGFKWLRYRLCW